MSRIKKRKNLKKSDIQRRFSILMGLCTLEAVTSSSLFFILESPYLAAGLAPSGLAAAAVGLKKSYQNYQRIMMKNTR